MKTIILSIFLAYGIVLLFFLQTDKIEMPIKKIKQFNTIQATLIVLDDPIPVDINQSSQVLLKSLKKKYKQLFTYMEHLKTNNETQEIVGLYIRILEGLSHIQPETFAHLSGKKELEDIVRKQLRKELKENTFSNKHKAQLENVLENVLILDKKFLLQVVKNNAKNMSKNEKKILFKNISTSIQERAANYLLYKTHLIIDEGVALQTEGIKSESFEALNAFIEEQKERYTSKKAQEDYKEDFLVLKQSDNKSKASKLYIEHTAGILASLIIKNINHAENDYKSYMQHIEKNKNLLKDFE